MSFPRIGPLEQCTVIFCLASFTSSTLKTELPAANDAPLHRTHRSASSERRRASFWGPTFTPSPPAPPPPPAAPLGPESTFALPTRTAASPLSPRMCQPEVILARRACKAACSPSKSVSRANTPADGPDMESSIRRQISSGAGELGPPLPMVVVRPYNVQYAVAGSGLPSSSSSDVVNLRQRRYRLRVYTSLDDANCLPPRDHPSARAVDTPAPAAALAPSGPVATGAAAPVAPGLAPVCA
mmetsp:Transcript_10591/g.31250  ORF Transcript_10591/g.31250 Transcript_10591/m.31250 type:complete len:241 (+) Transcript_10591:1497-2219(+)